MHAKRNKLTITSSIVGLELYNILESKKIITENDVDDLLFYKSVLTRQRASKSHMHLTIAPTMDCCFRCHYCFEEFKEKDYMTEEVMNSIVNHVVSFSNKPNYNLTWFGGEPLMAIDQMEQLYNKLKFEYKEPVRSNIITTGYHINDKVIEVLKNINVGQIQITLDGHKNTHNKVKFLSDCEDVFGKVLDNVELLLRTSDIHVVFRINLTKLNSHEYVSLYKELIDRYKEFKNVGISPGFVMDRGSSTNMLEGEEAIFFSRKEASQFILDLYNKFQIHSPFIRYPSLFFEECAIKNIMSVSFDPAGYAYKCWEGIGNKKYAIGRLDKDGRIYDLNQKIYNRHLYGADPLEDHTCSQCRYLPICSGGCPIQQLENIFDGKNNDCCTFYKGQLENYLKIHLKLKDKKYISVKK